MKEIFRILNTGLIVAFSFSANKLYKWAFQKFGALNPSYLVNHKMGAITTGLISITIGLLFLIFIYKDDKYSIDKKIPFSTIVNIILTNIFIWLGYWLLKEVF